MSNIVGLRRIQSELKMASLPARPDALSFVSRRKSRDSGYGYNYWDVNPSGSYADDCTAGAALADEYLAFIGAYPTYGNGTLLACIVREMTNQAKDGGSWTGLHIGFLTGVNRYAMAAAALMPA